MLESLIDEFKKAFATAGTAATAKTFERDGS
jgi:hypothetical protein